MGMHRRTKVEQMRERDLMMPQEVRQLPTQELVILAENQNPVRANKLRYFQTAPFAAMERFSRANLPGVPATEFLPQRPVPAVAPKSIQFSTRERGRKGASFEQLGCTNSCSILNANIPRGQRSGSLCRRSGPR